MEKVWYSNCNYRFLIRSVDLNYHKKILIFSKLVRFFFLFLCCEISKTQKHETQPDIRRNCELTLKLAKIKDVQF